MTHSVLKRVGAGMALMLALGGCRGRGQAEAVPMQATDEQPFIAQTASLAQAPLAATPVAGGYADGGGRVVGHVGGPGGGVNTPRAEPERQTAPIVPVPTGRKLIRDAHAILEVPSVEQALAKLRAQIERAGGYVTAESRRRDARGLNRGDLTLRVPAATLDTLMAGLASLGKVEQTWTTAGDITEEYFDLELRLNNQRQLQARLLELLNRAGNKLSDLLETERELARVRGEIEQLEGRQRFWDNRVSLATLMVMMHEPLPAVATAAGGPFAALKHSFSEAADNFVYAIAGVIAFTGGLIPIAAAILLGLWIIAKLWKLRKRSKARKAQNTTS